MKYKLLKNLPSLRSGATFRVSHDKTGYCNCIDPIGINQNVKPHYYFLKEVVETEPYWFKEEE